MTAMTGYLRKGQNRPAATGRAARRIEQRQQARVFSRNHGMHVIGHHQRAVAAASRQGWLFAGDYLADLGVDSRYTAAFGNATVKAYRENHGTDPDRGGWSIVNGRLRVTYRYTNELDLIAGALAYARTRSIVLIHEAVPGHPLAHMYASTNA